MLTKMEEKRGMKTYKVIMLVLLVAFITFILTTIGMYKYFTGTGFGKSLVSSSNAIFELSIPIFSPLTVKFNHSFI